jgi:acylphosphatase
MSVDIPQVRRRVIVHGRVQGVFFRGATRARAQQLGVAGWVRNRADGSVEAVFEGSTGAVEAMLLFAHHGPEWADVERVEEHAEEPQHERGFAIR